MRVRPHDHYFPLARRPLDVQPNSWPSLGLHRSPSGSHLNKLQINFRLILSTNTAIAVDTFLFRIVHRVWRVPAQVAALPGVLLPGSPQRYPRAAHRSAAFLHRSSTDSPTGVPRTPAPVNSPGWANRASCRHLVSGHRLRPGCPGRGVPVRARPARSRGLCVPGWLAARDRPLVPQPALPQKEEVILRVSRPVLSAR